MAFTQVMADDSPIFTEKSKEQMVFEKQGARIEIQPRFNPISYEKPYPL